MSFAALLRGAAPTPDGFSLRIPESWQQGRTAFGGFSTALALSAVMRVGGDELPPLRSAVVGFVGPLAGEVVVSARALRTGRNASWLTAEVASEQGTGLTACFVFMRPGQNGLMLEQGPMPAAIIPVDQAQPVGEGAALPNFLRNHFEVRFALPLAPQKRPEICLWVRPMHGEGLSAMMSLVLTADALPPAVMPLLDKGARISSMTWQINLLTPAPATRDGWWLLRSIGDFAENGCSSQRMAIWNADGAPMASGMQSVALFD